MSSYGLPQSQIAHPASGWRSRVPGEIYPLVEAALDQGWEPAIRGSGHITFRPPNGKRDVTISMNNPHPQATRHQFLERGLILPTRKSDGSPDEESPPETLTECLSQLSLAISALELARESITNPDDAPLADWIARLSDHVGTVHQTVREIIFPDEAPSVEN